MGHDALPLPRMYGAYVYLARGIKKAGGELRGWEGAWGEERGRGMGKVGRGMVEWSGKCGVRKKVGRKVEKRVGT